MSATKRIIKNTGILFTGDLFGKILTLILTILITRSLAVEEFGAFSFAIGFTTLFIILADLGINNYIRREIARDTTNINTYISNTFIAKIVLVIITIILTIVSAYLLQYSQETMYLVTLAILTASIETLTGTFNSAFIGVENMMTTTIIKSVRIILRFIAVLAVLFSGYGAVGILYAYLITQVFSLFVHRIYYSKKITPFIWSGTYKGAFNTLKAGLPFGIATLFIMIYFKIDITMLSKMQGDVAVGMYSAAYNLLEGLYYIPIAITTALLPVTSRLFIENKDKLQQLVEKANKYILLLSIPIAIGATLLSEHIIRFIYGEAYAESAYALTILIWTVIPSFFTYILGLILVSTNQEKAGMYITGTAALVNVILNLLLIPYFGFVGAAIATVLTELALFAMNYSRVRLTLFTMTLKDILKPLIAGIIMGIGIYYIAGHVHVLFSIAIGVTLYGLSLLAIQGVDLREIKQLLKR